MRTILRNLYDAEAAMDRQNYGQARELVGMALEALQAGPWPFLEFDRDMWSRAKADMERRAREAAQEAARKDFAQTAHPCHGVACACSSGTGAE